MLWDAELIVNLLLVRQHRAIEDVTQAGLKVAIQIGQHQDIVVLFQFHIAVPFQHHPVHGQGARLVRAQDVHRAEVLDGVQPLDDDLLPRHSEGALGKANRHDHGQHLGRHSHGDRQGEEERLVPVVLGQPIDEEDQGHHHHHEPDHQPGELGHALVEAGQDPLAHDGLGHSPQVGAPSRAHHHAGRAAALDAGAEEADVLPFERRGRRDGFACVELLHRHGFAGQAGLDDEQVLARKQPKVSRDHVPGRQAHDVARHQLGQRDFACLAAADHGGGDPDHGLQLGRRRARLCLLDETQRHAQHHHHDHDDSGPQVTGQG